MDMFNKADQKKDDVEAVPKSPRSQMNYKVNKTLDDFENSIRIKIIKMRCQLSIDINGYSGASKPPPFDQEDVSKLVNKRFDKLEKDINIEMEKINTLRKEI